MKKITLFMVILLSTWMASTSMVSAQTQLTVPTVGTATLISTVGFTANWTPGDANATSFDVKVYDSTPSLIKTVNVTGAATNITAIIGLTASTAYTFTVTAKGDGINFTDSPESSPASVSTNAVITLTTPTVGMASRVTLTGFTANWTAVTNATSYDVNVYQGTTLVTGSPKNVTGAASASLAITGMLAPATTYTYTVTAKGDGITYANSIVSSGSASFTTPVAGSFVQQYADVDVLTLNADLKAGAADIYELTTSGGNYTFNTGSTSNNNTLIRSTTIRAAAGLTAKPILKINSTTVGSTANMFNTTTPNITFTLSGLELNGSNAGSTTGLLLFIASGTTATNCSVYISNCVIHDFQITNGNGLIRLDGFTASAPTGLIDIQGTTIYNFSGRTLFLNPATTAGLLTSANINLKNNTFYNNSVQSSRANIIYNTNASSCWSGTYTIDHCTFYNLVTTSSTEGIIRQNTAATGGKILISNCIFMTVPVPLSNIATVSYSYLAGFTGTPTPTGTNTFTTAPTFTDITNSNSANYNFRLTNPTSFICADGFVAGNTYNMLAVPSVSTGNNATNVGFTANWTPVANASSYDVNVYQGSTLISTTNASGQSASTLTITGLAGQTDYTYTVIARGDGINYFDSTPSLASATVTTQLGTGVNQIGNTGFVTVSGKKVVCSESGTMQFYNLQGKQVLLVKNASEVNTGLESGIYLLRFTNQAGKQLIQKIAIQ